MIFNSTTFFAFFGIFFILYWFAFHKKLKQQNILLLMSSYVFYAWTDWRLLSYLIFVSILNFYLGIYIKKSTKYKRTLLYIGLLQGVGGLFFFKYYNFFIGSFNSLFESLNISFDIQTLQIIIPIGISFFTFKTISYLLDVDKGKIEPTTNGVVFFNYVSFFPTILSGPIDKAKSFVPQLEKNRVFNYKEAIDGLRQILWGFFKKIVIANNCAVISNEIFNSYTDYSGSSLVFGLFFYTIMLYADFSGYSDMAIGFSRIIGFNITKNFDFPFFSQNIAGFWRKWHISLTIWLTEYVFTPISIALRNYASKGLIIAIIINFIICGIWHGASWNYVLFGFLHGIYFIPLILRGKLNKKKKIAPNKLFPSLQEFINISSNFILVMLTFVFFKYQNLDDAWNYLATIFSKSLFSVPDFSGMKHAIITIVLIIIFTCIEWMGKADEYAIQRIVDNYKKPLRYLFYYLIILSLFWFSGEEHQFIYLQF